MSREPSPPPILAPHAADSYSVVLIALSLTMLAIAPMASLVCFPLGPIPAVAGLVLALIARHSAARLLALIGNGIMLPLSLAWIWVCLWAITELP